ncbi:MAG: hypothetical protein R2741_08700 [Methanolobus sp.]
MRIDNIRAMLVTDSAVTSLAQAVNYNYTSSTPAGTAVTGRTISISTEDSDGDSSTTATLSVYGDSPTFNSASSFSISEDESKKPDFSIALITAG